jgi:hypothetical protein
MPPPGREEGRTTDAMATTTLGFGFPETRIKAVRKGGRGR